MVLGSSPVTVAWTSDIVPVLSKEFCDIQATLEWIHSEMCTWHDKNIQSTIWSICKDHGGPFTSVRELLANTKNFNGEAKIKGILRNEILLCKSMSAKQG